MQPFSVVIRLNGDAIVEIDMPVRNLFVPLTAAAALTFACIPAPAPAASSATLFGSVTAEGAVPIVVVALDGASGRVMHRLFLERPGEFRMPLSPGRYRLYAYADSDRDGARASGEPISPLYVLASPLRAGDRIALPALELAD